MHDTVANHGSRNPNLDKPFLTVTLPDKKAGWQHWTCLYILYSEIRALEAYDSR